jgi:hypothetical protein
VDEVTTLNSVSASGSTLTYHYALTNVGQLTPSQLDSVRESVVQAACKNSDSDTLMKQGTTLGYEYTNNGQVVLSFIIRSQDCGQK